MRLHRDVLDGHRCRRVAFDVEGTLLPFQVGYGDFQHSGRDDLGLIADLAGHQCGGCAGDRSGPAAVGAQPERRLVGIAVHHVDVLRRDTQFLGDDLGEGRLVALALGLHRKPHHRFTGRVDTQLTPVGHAQAKNVHILARACADSLGEEGHPDAHQLAALALLGLLGTQLLVADHVHGLAHRGLVVTRVIQPAGLALVRELLGLQQVLQPQLGRIHLEIESQTIHQSLDEVDRLGDAERAGVRHASGCLIGEHRGHVAVGGLDVVAAGEDAEEAGRVLDG